MYNIIYNPYKYLFANINAQRTKWSYIFVHEHKHTKSTILLCLFVFVYATTHARVSFSLYNIISAIFCEYIAIIKLLMLGIGVLGTPVLLVRLTSSIS